MRNKTMIPLIATLLLGLQSAIGTTGPAHATDAQTQHQMPMMGDCQWRSDEQGQGKMGQGHGMMGHGMMGQGQGMMSQRHGQMGQRHGQMGQGYGMRNQSDEMMGPRRRAGHGMRYQHQKGGHRKALGSGNRVVAIEHLSTDDVRHFLEHRLELQGYKALQPGKVEESDRETITAEIVTSDGSLVQRLKVDRHSGAITVLE